MKFYPLLALLLLSQMVLAQNVDTAIIATDITSVDMHIAMTAAGKAGAPVFVAENGIIPDSTLQVLAAANIKTVILVGGPAVIKEEAKETLESLGYTVLRLWGIERTGTALEVMKHFWPEGAGCAVLVDDTKNSDSDVRMQLKASILASSKGCAMIPVPKGTLPAEVLSSMENFSVSEIRFIGKELKQELREKLKSFRVVATTGNETEIEIEIETELAENATKLVIVAVPEWKHGLGVGAHPSGESVVKMIFSMNQSSRLISFIKENNFTEIKVVGTPALAQGIAAALEKENITVSKVSGERASEIAKKIWEEKKGRWKEIKKNHDEARERVREKIQLRLRNIANETGLELDELEIELEGSGVNVAALKAKLEEARTLIDEALQKLNDTEEAGRLLARAKFEFRSRMWNDRERIKWDFRLRIRSEEAGMDDIEKDNSGKLAELEKDIASLRKSCKADAIESLVTKAKSLRDTATEEDGKGNFTRAAELRLEVKKLVEQAKSLGKICKRDRKISEATEKLAEKRGERAEKVAEKVRKLIVKKSGDETKRISGTMRLVGVEGGCWRLKGDDGKNYELTMLPARITLKEGLKLTVDVKDAEGASICQVGNLVEVTNVVEATEPAAAATATATPAATATPVATSTPSPV